jgi:hypothetical protein
MPGIIPPIIPPIIGFIIPGPIIPGANMVAVERCYRYADESRNPPMSSKEATIRQTQPCRYYINKRDRGQRKIGRQLCNSLGPSEEKSRWQIVPTSNILWDQKKHPPARAGRGNAILINYVIWFSLVSPRSNSIVRLTDTRQSIQRVLSITTVQRAR